MGEWVRDGRAADSSVLRVVSPLRTSASAIPAAGPRLLPPRLRTRQKEGEKGGCSVAWLWAILARTPALGTWFEGRPSCARLSARCRHQLAARGSQLVALQVQLGDLVALDRREERAHVHGAEHLKLEVHLLAARRLALDLDQRGAVRLDHLVLQARDQRLVVGVGERTAAGHAALV
eukprot:scaffold43949_cov50-Phaeocystis_antarctica.AAC.4